MHSEFYDGRTVLVTGGAGAIGSRLVHRLVAVGADVVVLDDLSSGYQYHLPEGVDLVTGTISSESDLADTLEADPTVLFHMAAFFANQNSVDHPVADQETNVEGLLRVLHNSAKTDCIDRLVYASSSCVYDDGESLPFTESEMVSLDFNTPYEITKTFGEAYCNYFSSAETIEIVRARIFNSYGPGEVPGKYRNVIPNFIYYAKQGDPLPITGSGEETRDFTYVDDVVDGFLAMGAVEDAAGEAFNLATGTETTIQTLAETINTLVGNDAGIEYHSRRSWDETDRRRGSIAKAQATLDYEPSIELEAGLSRTIDWFDQHWEWITDSAEF